MDEVMSRNALLYILVAMVAVPLFILSSCGKIQDREPTVAPGASAGPGTDQPGTGQPGTGSSNCGPDQKMENYKAVWVYTNCSPPATLLINPDTESDNGTPLKTLDVNRGMISFRYSGMHNDMIPSNPTFALFFKSRGWEGYEANWQWMTTKQGGKFLQHRLVSQRFDGTCGRRYCEVWEAINELQFFDETDVFQWDCQWDTSASKIACVVVKVGDPKIMFSLQTDPKGPFFILTYLGLGNGAYDGDKYLGYQGQLSDVKLTFFEAP